MATLQSFNYADNSTLAHFKQWAMSISTALATFGWTKTSDSGQVNWTTISSVPSNPSGYVYEIWQSADALSSTLPMFLRLQYGWCPIYSPAAVALQIFVGTGSDGAGNLIGNSGSLYNTYGITVTSGGASNTYECDFSGSTNRFQMTMFRGWTYPAFFSIERAHDMNGNDLGTSFTYITQGLLYGPNTVVSQQQTYYPAAGGWLPVETNWVSVQSSASKSPLVNAPIITPVWPLIGKLDNPLLGAMVIKNGDFIDGMIFQATMYNTAHIYMAVPSVYSSGVVGRGAGNAIAMRYE